jgi:hypothetical protein
MYELQKKEMKTEIKRRLHFRQQSPPSSYRRGMWGPGVLDSLERLSSRLCWSGTSSDSHCRTAGSENFTAQAEPGQLPRHEATDPLLSIKMPGLTWHEGLHCSCHKRTKTLVLQCPQKSLEAISTHLRVWFVCIFLVESRDMAIPDAWASGNALSSPPASNTRSHGRGSYFPFLNLCKATTTCCHLT